MKTKIGEPAYPFKGGVKSAQIKGQKKPIPILVITLDDMKKMREKNPYMRGIPAYIAFDAKKEEVLFFPSPQGEFIVEIEAGHSVPPPKQSVVGTITGSMLRK